MMRGVVCSLFVVALAGTAVAQESPVQVVDKPAATETATPKATKATKSHKPKAKSHKAKHKARKHKKSARHGKASTPTAPK